MSTETQATPTSGQSLPAGYRFRQAVREDAPALLPMILALADESEGMALNPDTLRRGIDAVFADPAKGRYWVLEHEDRILACALTTTEWSDWHNAHYWWLQSIYLQPDARGQGLIQGFLAALTTTLRSEASAEIRLYVDKTNTRAIQAYLKSGFSASHYLLMSC